MRRLALPWQDRALAYYDAVPEIKYGAQFYSRSLSVLRLYAAKRTPDGEVEETEDPVAVEQLERMQDPGGGGREQMLSTYGRLRFLTGESFLVVSLDPDTGREQWEVCSHREIRAEGSGYIRVRAPGLAPETLREPADENDWEPTDEKTAVVYRLWNRHPKYSQQADSTMQGVLDLCEELVLLTQAVRSRARSRLAGAGLMIVNSRFIPPPPRPANNDDVIADPFMRDLIDAMTAPIQNEGSASAVVPHVIRVDVPSTENLDNVLKHVQIVDPMQHYPETGLRMELIKRLSIGLDMPPEILVGLADSNHWNAWQVDEQTWKGHLQPVANAMVNDFTTAWFQPSLRAAGVDNWDEYVIAYDATAVINHPDRGKDAQDAYDRRAIGKAALREAKGFTEEDAPTQEELWEMLGVSVRDGSLALFGIPSVRTAVEPAPGEIVEGGTVTQAPNVEPGTAGTTETSGDVVKQAPTPPNVVGSALADFELSAFHDRVIGASGIAFFRARDLAGSRLRSYAKRNPDAKRLLEGVPSHKVAATLGPELARTIGAPPARQLVAGAAELLSETLETWGVPQAASAWLGDRLEQYAAAKLFDDRPSALPETFAAYVRTLDRNGKVEEAVA